MSEKISVLIADDNIQFANLLQEYISHNSDMHVVGIARDGIQAIDMIKSLNPDVVILDIIMPNLDGIGVLERLSATQSCSKPSIIVLTALGQDIFIQKAMALGAGYYIVKPFDVEVLSSRIREIHKRKCFSLFTHDRQYQEEYQEEKPQENGPDYSQYLNHDIEIIVTGLMRSVGIPPHMIGYRYIREAVIQIINSPNIFNSITKVLYPTVAQKFNSTPQRVERAIRNAIDSAWTKGRLKYIESAFGYGSTKIKDKPTNSEFIALVADKARLTLGIRL